jgi:CelD/BcsL family acetyltransferase involved in cellulose biosynthesis
MNVSAIPARDLAQDHKQQWTALQQGNPHLSSPFFCPEYTLSVASARDDVWVGLLEERGNTVGFFPFQRDINRVGKPVGWPMCDYHGVIADPDLVWDAEQLLGGCDLEAWSFDHLIPSQTSFESFHRLRKESPIVNLTAGYDAYVAEKRCLGSEFLQQTARKTRKLAREVGPLRFEPQLLDHAALDHLLYWWAKKWTGLDQVGNWHQNTFHTILETRTPGFAGTLSTLHAGEELIAACFGIRSECVWHYWFPSYNVEFARYSPGASLLMKMLAVAPSLGISVVDLGVGKQRYKKHFMNDVIPIAEGTVGKPSLIASTRDLGRKLEDKIRERPFLLSTVRNAAARFRSIWHAFDSD